MSEYISARTGAYRHAPHLKFPKTFLSGDGGKRTFTILIAGARDAGIIASEDNGVVVIDEDNQTIVLDNLCQESTGYFGESERQIAAVRHLLSLDWKEFVVACRSSSNYRNYSISDAEQEYPEYRYPPSNDENRQIINPSIAESDKRGGVEYAVSHRVDIINWLAKHHFHHNRPYDKWRMAWNIKVHNFNDSGHVEGFNNDPAFDNQWASYLESDLNIFWNACSDILFEFISGLYSTYPGDDQGDYDFSTQGQSSGHLILTRMKDYSDQQLCWEDQIDFKQWAKCLSDEDLLALIRLVAHVDCSIAAKEDMLAYEFAVARSEKEREWKNLI